MALMADGHTVMVVIRVDGDGRCGMGDGPGPYRPYFASYSSDSGSSWSLAVPLKGTGCARPRLLRADIDRGWNAGVTERLRLLLGSLSTAGVVAVTR